MNAMVMEESDALIAMALDEMGIASSAQELVMIMISVVFIVMALEKINVVGAMVEVTRTATSAMVMELYIVTDAMVMVNYNALLVREKAKSPKSVQSVMVVVANSFK